MPENERDFKGVWIPKEVWLDTRLNALEKIILTEIDSLDSSERGCWASNQYIAEFCQCSESKVSKSISKLIELGYLYLQAFDGRQRELKSRLTSSTKQDSKLCEAETQTIPQINTKKNTKNNTSIQRFVPPTVEEVRAYCSERQNTVDAQRFVDYYTSNGWLVGRNKMKDWRAAVRTWERNASSRQQQGTIAVRSTAEDDLAGIF